MQIPAQIGRVFTPMLITAWIVTGCSGSSDSVTADIQQPAVDFSSDESSDSANELSNSDLSTDAPLTNDVITVTEVAPISEITVEEDVDATVNDPLDNVPFVADPEGQNRIFVTFDITVPAYQSDALRIELDWGDVNLTAAWVGDELWTVSAELPTETEERLTVTFFDDNGAIELARFSQDFRTGSNATEAFQISVDQFDAEQFDSDGDGVSNLDELIAGNDPTVDEDSLLEIRDAYRIFIDSRLSIISEIEALLSEERPISITNQEQIGPSGTIDTDIQIDSGGSGTLSRDRRFGCEFNLLSGVRTHLDNAISWEATQVDSNCDFSFRSELANTVTVTDENTRTFVETVDASLTGGFTNTWLNTANITGQLIDGTSFCEAVSGTYTGFFTSNNNGSRTVMTLVSKEVDDPYWRVEIEVRERVDFSDPNAVDVRTIEYFARDLLYPIEFSSDDPAVFKCDFVDI